MEGGHLCLGFCVTCGHGDRGPFKVKMFEPRFLRVEGRDCREKHAPVYRHKAKSAQKLSDSQTGTTRTARQTNPEIRVFGVTALR